MAGGMQPQLRGHYCSGSSLAIAFGCVTVYNRSCNSKNNAHPIVIVSANCHNMGRTCTCIGPGTAHQQGDHILTRGLHMAICQTTVKRVRAQH